MANSIHVQATPAEIDEMATLVNYDLFGPTGAVWNLPPEQRVLMASGKPGNAKPKVGIWVQDVATQHDKDLVHAGPSDALLGLYTAGDERFDGKPTIQIFADACLATGTSPSDVAIHEMGHVLDFNHTSRVGIVQNGGTAFTVCADCEPRLPHAHLESGTWSRDPDCALCRLCIDTAVVLCNLNDIRLRSHLQHQIPLGLGGLIVETRYWVTDAQSQLTEGAPLAPWMSASISACGGYLDQLTSMLAGMQTPESISKAWAVAYKARDSAVDITHAYFLHEYHGNGQVA